MWSWVKHDFQGISWQIQSLGTALIQSFQSTHMYSSWWGLSAEELTGAVSQNIHVLFPYVAYAS